MALPYFMLSIIDIARASRASLVMARVWLVLAVIGEIIEPTLDSSAIRLVFYFSCCFLWLLVHTGWIHVRQYNKDADSEDFDE